jgi:hypothetical protein
MIDFNKRPFADQVNAAAESKDFETLKKLAHQFAVQHLNPLDTDMKLGYLIGVHSSVFGGNPDKIRRDLCTLTKSSNPENHLRYILQAMIESTPEEDGDKANPVTWYYGQVFRMEKKLCEMDYAVLRSSTGHPSSPRLQ